MKVKETYSNDFKDDIVKIKDVCTEENGEKILCKFGAEEQMMLDNPDHSIIGEKDGFIMREIKKYFTCTGNGYQENELPYSEYHLECNHKWLMALFVPDPYYEDSFTSYRKDCYLRYQTGFRKFMKNIFNVLTNQEDDFEGYEYDEENRLGFELADDDTVTLLLYKEGEPWRKIGAIDFCDPRVSLRVAENLVKYFKGEKIEDSWREICGQ